MKMLAIGMVLLLATLAPVSVSSPAGEGLAVALQGCAAQEGGDEEGHCKLVFENRCCADGPCMYGFTIKTED